MNKNILLLIFMSLFFITTISYTQINHHKIFPFKSAIIKYKYEASLVGTRIKYIDDYGYLQADYIVKETNFGGVKEKESTTIILKGSKAYTIDNTEKTISVGKNATYGYYEVFKKKSSEEIFESLLKSESYEKKNSENPILYLGKECDNWEARKAEQLVWNNLVIKSEQYFMALVVEKATSITIGIDISAERFNLPKDYTLIYSDTQQGYAGLKLKFDNDEDIHDKKKEESSNSVIRVDLEVDLFKTDSYPEILSTNDKKDKELYFDGSSMFQRIDKALIESQEFRFTENSARLSEGSPILFKTSKGKCGKLEAVNIDKKQGKIEVRFVIYNSDGKIYKFSKKCYLSDKSEIISDYFEIKEVSSFWGTLNFKNNVRGFYFND